MKKSSLFKILTLFLTFVIFSCSSGCLTLYFNHKKLQEALEIEKQRKELADALIPEIEGYTFEARPARYFASKEDIEIQGFKTIDGFFDGNKANNYYLEITELEGGGRKVVIKQYNYSNEGDNHIINYIIISPEQERNFGEIFPVFPRHPYFIYNGESFIARYMEEVFAGRYKSSWGGIALFLINFEKHEMYYVGYSKGWIESELRDNELYSIASIYLKLAKNGGEMK